MKIKHLAALVTGGASGIGAGVVDVLTQAGAKVAILDRNIELAEQKAKEVGGIAIACDVARDESVQQAISAAQAQNGPARILVNCAGIDTARKIASHKSGAHAIGPMQRVIDVNLVGTLSCCAHASTAMLDLDTLDEEQSEAQTEGAKKLKIHQERLLETSRKIHMIYASLMVGAAECIPLGVLQGREASIPQHICHGSFKLPQGALGVLQGVYVRLIAVACGVFACVLLQFCCFFFARVSCCS